MTKVLFVCYQHGCQGESLTYKISKHKFFKTLEAKIVNNRTIITNDFFNKQLLNSWAPDMASMELPTNHNIVVPSHYFYDVMKKYFPGAHFVSIDLPKDLKTFKEKLYNRFYTYQTKNMLEIAGECKNRFREYKPQASVKDIMQFTAKIFKIKDVTFGDIRCLVKGLEPTEDNKKILLNSYTLDPLSAETKQNSFVIAYEDIDKTNVENIIDYVNK